MSHSQNKPKKLSASDTFPFRESIHLKIFHNNPTPQSLSNRDDHQIVDVNEAWEKFTGYKKEKIIGRSIEDLNLMASASPDNLNTEFREDDPSRWHEKKFIRKNGKFTYGLVAFKNIEFENVHYVISTILDICILKESPYQLNRADNFSDLLLDGIYEAIIVFDLDFTCIKVNKAYCELTGFKEKDILGSKAPFPHCAPEHYDTIKANLQQGADGVFKREQLTMKKANGERFEMSMALTKITNKDKDIIGYVSTAVDVSERVKYQEELQENSKKSVEKKDAILQMLHLIGKDFNQTIKKLTAIAARVMEVKRVSLWQFNDNETKMHLLNAYSSDSNKVQNDVSIYTKDNPDYFKALNKKSTVKVDDVGDSNLNKDFIKTYLKPIGISSMLDVLIKWDNSLFGVVCFEHVGDPRTWTVEEEEFATTIASIVSLAVENCERRKVETKLLLEKEFSDELLGSLREGLSVVNIEGEIIRVNNALCKMTGFKESELLGSKPPFTYWPPDCYQDTYSSYKNMFEQSKTTQELTFMRKNGERFPVSLTFSSVKDKEGHLTAYFTTITDISDRINEEELLRQDIKISQKRKAVISKLVAMIGHDYEDTIEEIIKLSAEALDADCVTFWKFKKDDTQLVRKVFYNYKEKFLGKDTLILERVDFMEYFEVFESQSVLNIKDVSNHPITQRYPNIFNGTSQIKSHLDVVVYGKNMSYGLLSFNNCEDHRIFSDEEENFAISIANIISLMVEGRERAALENQLVKTNDKLLGVNTELKTLKKGLEQENTYLREEIDLAFNYEEMVYGSRSFSQVLTDVERVAATNATVLLLGESGTGKELLARAIHNISKRSSKPLIKVNCAAIPRELIESELFGHKKGSFTGAINDKLGKFQLADGGTLFLDEIGELPLEMQPKLLRAIQECEIEQVGGTKTQKVDIRIIVATNRDLEKEIKEKNFREDLFFRINVFPINIPPLRERIEDIPILIEHFVNKYAKLYNKKIKYISEETKRNLQSYAWPGNVRELENLVERAVILCNDEKLVVPNFKSSSKESLISSTVLSLEDVQRIHIKKILKQCHWKIDGPDGAAKLLQMKPSTLRDRMRKFDIARPL